VTSCISQMHPVNGSTLPMRFKKLNKKNNSYKMDQKKGYIYLITNIITNRCYVGQTGVPNIRRRFHGHFNTAMNGSLAPLHVDMRLYGKSAFKIEQLSHVSLASLNNMEAYWAEQLGTYITDTSFNGTRGYNVRSCGESDVEKISINKKGKGASSWWIGRKHKPESLVKIGDTWRGKKFTEEHKEKLRQSHCGRVQTEAHNQKARANRITNVIEKGAKGVKLSKKDVLQIITYNDEGKSQTDIAELFNVQISVISRILSGDRWGYVTGIARKEPEKRSHGPLGMEEAEKIRSLYALKEHSYSSLAEIYNVHKTTIANIIKNKLYPRV